jgi:outer membrane protein assembly factor BamB
MENATLTTQSANLGAARVARQCAWAGVVFCLIVGAVLMGLMIRDKVSNPLLAPQLEKAKTELKAKPQEEAMKTRVREADAQVRADYWRVHGRRTLGGYLLLAGAVVAVVCMKLSRKLEQRLPTLEGMRAVREPELAPARWAVVGAAGAVLSLFVVGGVAGWSMWSPPTTVVVVAPSKIERIAFPDEATLAANWPVFRGWGGSGLVASAGKAGVWPTKWDGKTGEGIVWKSPVPLEGHSSPIVWKDRVFVTGADESKRKVFCFDAATGGLVWTASVPGVPGGGVEAYEATGYAASTPATDGTLVYAIFATGDVAAFACDSGARQWVRHVGTPESTYSYAASLTVWNGKLIVQWDVGKEAPGTASALLALDGVTGETVWSTARPVINSWSSPIVARTAAGVQIVTAANPWVIGYDAASGAELWRAKLMDGDVAACPVSAEGEVYVANDRSCLARIATDGKGDVTKTHVKWKADEEGLPAIASPLSDGKLLWTITESGTMFCFDAADGKKVYEHELQKGAQASPVRVGDELWVLDLKGTMFVLEAGREDKVIRSSGIGEGTTASPAFAGGKVYIRGSKNLYCIGSK